MKPILIEQLIKEQSTSQEFAVDVDGVLMKGYQLAKPLNYGPEYLSVEERAEMAAAIMNGKAIAYCYFEDLTSEEQSEYVRGQMNT